MIAQVGQYMASWRGLSVEWEGWNGKKKRNKWLATQEHKVKQEKKAMNGGYGDLIALIQVRKQL